VDIALDLCLLAWALVGVVGYLSLWVYLFAPVMIMTIRLAHDVSVVLSAG